MGELAPAVLAAEGVAHRLVAHGRPTFGPDLDDARGGPGAVEGRRRGTFHHLDALDVQSVQIHQIIPQDHPIHDVYGTKEGTRV